MHMWALFVWVCPHTFVPCGQLPDTPGWLHVWYAVSAAEDPEKILDQAVEDMQGDLIRLRQAAAEVRRGGGLGI